MTDKATELARVKQDIRSLLLSSPKGYTMNLLEKDFKNMLGKRIPYERFGYSDLEQFLKCLPDVVQMRYCPHPRGYILTGVANEKTRHIQNLVSRQKTSLSGYADPYKDLQRSSGRPRCSNRASCYGQSNTVSIADRPPLLRRPTPTTNVYVAPHARVVPFSEQIRVKELITCYSDGMRIGNFERLYYQKFGIEFLPEDYGFPGLKECLASMTTIVNLIPDRDSYQVCPTRPTLVPAHHKPGSPPASSPSSPPPAVAPDKPSISFAGNKESSPISQTLITNLKRVLAQFPGGLLLNRLLVEYERIVKAPLNCCDYGFHTALELVGELKDVFHMERPFGRGGDWLLFDASKPPPQPALKAEEVQTKPQSQGLPSTISARIKANIETVLLGHSDGIMVDQFQSVYKRNCGEDLPWQDLGYDSIINFFLALPSVQLYPCKSGSVVVVHASKAKTVSDDPSIKEFIFYKIPDIPVDPVLPGVDFKYQTLSVEMSAKRYIAIFVSQINNPGDIWIQLRGMDTTEELENMMCQLEEVYNKDDAMQYEIPDSYLKVNMVCAVIYPQDKNQDWHRGKITSIISRTRVEVFFVDYGSICQVERKTLRFLRKDFIHFPAQAIRARLANLRPVGREWAVEAGSLLLNMCSMKPLQAKITSVTYKNRISVNLVDTNGENDIHINAALLQANLAQYVNDEEAELASPNSFLEGQNSSISLADLSYQVRVQAAYLAQLGANPMNYMVPYSGVNNCMPYTPTPEDRGIDSKVYQKMVAMGEVKPLEVDTRSANMNIPVRPGGSVYSSSSSSPDSVAESLVKVSVDAGHKNEESGQNMPDVIKVANTEPKQYRYSQIISLNDYDLHLINYKGNPYMTSADISLIIWGIDVLKKLLIQRKMNDPSITIYKNEAEDLFADLEKNHVKVLSDGASVHLFPIQSVKEIVSVFHKKNGKNIVQQLEELERNFNSLDPYWTQESKGGLIAAEEEAETDLERKLHLLIQKRFKLLQDMIQTPKGDSVCIIELQEVEEKIKHVEAEIKGETPRKDPVDSQKKPINPVPGLHQNSALGLPIRQIQSVRPTINQRNASVPLMPQGNNSLSCQQLPLISMVPQVTYPPGMCYPLPYQLQQNPFMPQNVSAFIPPNVLRNPTQNVPYSSWSSNN